jgi:hypothetical protein
MFLSACSFIALVLTVFHYTFQDYMAIFKCVRYFIFICLNDFASLLFFGSLPFFSRGHTLHVFHLCFVAVLFSFVIFVVSLHVCLSACSFFVVCAPITYFFYNPILFAIFTKLANCLQTYIVACRRVFSNT